MGANQSVENASSNRHTSQRPKNSRSTSATGDAGSENTTKKIKLDELLQNASPKHSPVSTLHQSRIDTYVSLPPLPITELQRNATMKVNLERGPSHVPSPPKSISALSDRPEGIPFIKRRSLIYAVKPGLSTRLPKRLSSSKELMHVDSEATTNLPLLKDNALPGNIRDIDRTITPAINDIRIGAFRKGTLRVVNVDAVAAMADPVSTSSDDSPGECSLKELLVDQSRPPSFKDDSSISSRSCTRSRDYEQHIRT